MARLPAAAPIDLAQIVSFFGAPAGTPLASMVRGGSYVLNYPANSGVPTAPPIGLLHFLNASNSSPVNITDQNISQSAVLSSGSSIAGYRLNASGIAERHLGAAYSTIETWLLEGAAGDYEVRATVTGGSTVPNGVSSPVGTWLALSTSREWQVARALNSSGVDTTQLLIEIRAVSNSFVCDTATVNLESERA